MSGLPHYNRYCTYYDKDFETRHPYCPECYSSKLASNDERNILPLKYYVKSECHCLECGWRGYCIDLISITVTEYKEKYERIKKLEKILKYEQI